MNLGYLITSLSVLVSALAVAVSLHKDRIVRKREFADRIRRSAGVVAAKLERFSQVALSFFADVQPVLTAADSEIVQSQNILGTRDMLWQRLVTFHAATLQRILDEQIEIAYADLHGYDPRIRGLFLAALDRLKQFEDSAYLTLLRDSQRKVLAFEQEPLPFRGAHLGNALRADAALCRAGCEQQMSATVRAFQQEMSKLIAASDAKIVKKQVMIGTANSLFPAMPDLVSVIDEPAIELAHDFDKAPRFSRHIHITKARCQMPTMFRHSFELDNRKGINLSPSRTNVPNNE